MKFTLPAGSDVRVGWMLVAALAVAGYALAIAPVERDVRAVAFRAHDLYERSERNERMLRQVRGLQAARSRVQRDIATLSSQNEMGKADLAALALLQFESTERHLTISELSPGQSVAGADDGVQPVTIGVRGNYRDAIAAIADLTRHDVLIELEGATLSATSRRDGLSQVDAVVQATLYHGVASIMKGKNRETTLR